MYLNSYHIMDVSTKSVLHKNHLLSSRHLIILVFMYSCSDDRSVKMFDITSASLITSFNHHEYVFLFCLRM